MTAGETVNETITVSATGDEAIVVELVHADFGFGEDYAPVLIRDDAPETTAFSTRGWFSTSKERYRVAAGRSVDVPLRIDVPENTPGGTFLGAALIRIVPPDPTGGGSQVQAVPETGPLVFIAVEGGDPPKAGMRSFRLPSLVTSGPLRPRLVVENRGDEFFTYEGTVRLSGPGKDDEVKIERQFVVPGEPRDVVTNADDKGSIVLGSKALAMGRYEVTSRLRIEPVGTTLVSTRTVWVIPTWARVAAVVLLLVLLACLTLLGRWFIARRRDAEVDPEDDADEASDDVVEDDEVGDELGDDEVGDELVDDELDDEDLEDDDLADVEDDDLDSDEDLS